MRIGGLNMAAPLAVSFVDEETSLSGLPVWWETEVEQGLVGVFVPGPDLHQSACVLAGGHSPPELLGNADHLLDLPDRTHALALLSPNVVLDPDPDVLAEGDGNHRERQHGPHPGLHEHDRAVGRAANVLQQVEWIPARRAAPDRDELMIERTRIEAGADQPLDGLELVDVSQHEERLDVVRPQALEVLDIEGRPRLGVHVRPRGPRLRILELRPLDVILVRHLGDVHGAGSDRDRDLIRLGFYLGDPVPRVVALPLRLLALWSERDRAADLQDHVRDRAPDAVH